MAGGATLRFISFSSNSHTHSPEKASNLKFETSDNLKYFKGESLVKIDSPRKFFRARTAVIAATACLLLSGLIPANAQGLNSEDRSRGHLILDDLKDDIKKNYYDTNFHGVTLGTLQRAHTSSKRQELAMSSIIAQTMLILTTRTPSLSRPIRRCFRIRWDWRASVTSAMSCRKPGSEAESRPQVERVLLVDGVIPGDRLVELDYLYRTLIPAPACGFDRKPWRDEGRVLDVPAKMTASKRTLNFTGMDDGHDIQQYIWDSERQDRIYRNRTAALGDELIIWKMPRFTISEEDVDAMMGKVRGRKALILDLRNNGGGYVRVLRWWHIVDTM